MSVSVAVIFGQVSDLRQRSSCPGKDPGNRVVGVAPALRRFLARELFFGVLGS